MKISRLSLALEEAGGLPTTGRILVLRPTPETDLGDLPKDRAVIVTGFRPDYEAFSAQGFAVAERAEGEFAAAIVIMPRSKALARAMVAEAVAAVDVGGPIWVDGQKTDGVESLYKDLRGRVEMSQSFAKAHGRAFVFAAPGADAFADWQAQTLTPLPGFVTRPGVFSADGVDPGSALLAAHLPADLKGKGADLGAGWGWLSTQVLRRAAVRELHLVEAEAEALVCARANIKDERAVFHWADATRFRPDAVLDFVVMNPPFHVTRSADPALGAGFIRAAAKMMHPAGRLCLVANRTLPYEEVLRSTFVIVSPVAISGGFKILLAARPKAGRPSGKPAGR